MSALPLLEFHPFQALETEGGGVFYMHIAVFLPSLDILEALDPKFHGFEKPCRILEARDQWDEITVQMDLFISTPEDSDESQKLILLYEGKATGTVRPREWSSADLEGKAEGMALQGRNCMGAIGSGAVVTCDTDDKASMVGLKLHKDFQTQVMGG
jgi:hypothetical protein